MNLDWYKGFKVRTDYGRSDVLYYVGISFDNFDEEKVYVFWTNGSFRQFGCAMDYTKSEIEEWIEVGSWVVVE